MRAAAVPPILKHAGPLLARYEVLFADVWGVVHNGLRAYPGAVDAMQRFRGSGGTVILVSNAPVPQDRVAEMLDTRAVARSAWDAIVSSGDIAMRHIAEKGYRRVYCIGPADRDAALFERLPAERVCLSDAEAIVCSGLNDDRNETEETYRPVLLQARAHDLPFVCANPDLIVEVGDHIYQCAGAIAALYEVLGGKVYWAGKPYPVAYETALKTAERLRGARVPRDRILAIGDAVRTDLKSAKNAGIGAIFIAGGIHRHETMESESIVPDKLARLFSEGDTPATAAMSFLRW